MMYHTQRGQAAPVLTTQGLAGRRQSLPSCGVKDQSLSLLFTLPRERRPAFHTALWFGTFWHGEGICGFLMGAVHTVPPSRGTLSQHLLDG